MKILVSGSTGLVGSALIPYLIRSGHVVTRLVRNRGDASSIYWDPMAGLLDPTSLEGFEAVIHLAGEGIATGRWSAAKKQRIRDSRVRGTRLLSETLARLPQPPKIFACASAIGFYGNRGDEILHEGSPAGTDFLANVCQAWETATSPAAQKGIRVVHLRFGIILSTEGGALAKMLIPFKLGVGGQIGTGHQYMSWVAREDVLGAIQHVLITPSLSGPLNIVAPKAVTNAEFTQTLGRVLSRPTFLPLPAFAAKLILGEMADALLLSSQRVEPTQLAQSHYAFQYTVLEDTLRHLLEKKA